MTFRRLIFRLCFILALLAPHVLFPSNQGLAENTHNLQQQKRFLPLVMRTPVTRLKIEGSIADAELSKSCTIWSACRDAASADRVNNGSGLGSVAASRDTSGNYNLKRIFLFFDTSMLPSNVTIVGVELYVYVGGTVTGTGQLGVIRNSATPPVTFAHFQSVDLTTTAGVFTPKPNSWAMVAFSPSTNGWVQKDGTTKLALTYLSDIKNISPTSSVDVNIFLSEEATYRPYLVVTYR